MDKIQEFWYCVASQDDLPLYKGHTISSEVCDNLLKFIDYYKEELKSRKDIETIISELINLIIQFTNSNTPF